MSKGGHKPLVSKNHLGETDRTFVAAPVSLKGNAGRVEGVACDVSENGIKVVTDQPPQLGPISVKLVGLPTFSGEVCWRSPQTVGVRLAQPLSAEVLADWILWHGLAR
jgi:hypothetical protein